MRCLQSSHPFLGLVAGTTLRLSDMIRRVKPENKCLDTQSDTCLAYLLGACRPSLASGEAEIPDLADASSRCGILGALPLSNQGREDITLSRLTARLAVTGARTITLAQCKDEHCHARAEGKAHVNILVNGILLVELQSDPGESIDYVVEQLQKPAEPALSEAEIAAVLSQ
jgi:hypothetical protein